MKKAIIKMCLEFSKHCELNKEVTHNEIFFRNWYETKYIDIFEEEIKHLKLDVIFEEIKNINILQHANYIIFNRSEEKSRQYGSFIESMSKAAEVATLLCNKEITTDDFYKCMIALKLSRLSYNTKYDTVLDAIGYLAAYNEFKNNNN